MLCNNSEKALIQLCCKANTKACLLCVLDSQVSACSAETGTKGWCVGCVFVYKIVQHVSLCVCCRFGWTDRRVNAVIRTDGAGVNTFII